MNIERGKKVQHPMQYLIDSGKLVLKHSMDISDEEFEEILKTKTSEKQKFLIKYRQEWKDRQIRQSCT